MKGTDWTMADNYLEKKFEEYRSGKAVIRKANPSLETLLRRITEVEGVKADSSGPEVLRTDVDASYIVKQAQLDAIVRAARLLELPLAYSTDEASATVRVAGDSEFALGQAMLAMRLKAAELGLRAVVIGPEPAGVSVGTAESITVSESITLLVYKSK